MPSAMYLRLEGLISLVSLNLSGNPISDYGPLRRLKTANPDITIDIDIDENDNSAACIHRWQ